MAIDILNELKKGNISFLSNLSDLDREYTINNIIGESKDKKEILNKILPIFRDNDNWYGLGYEIFKLIYLDNDFKEYTFYLLYKEYVKIIDLDKEKLKNILEHTTWGFDYIISNLTKCLDNPRIYEIISTLVEYVKDNKINYEILKEKIMKSNDQEIRDAFVLSSLNKHAFLKEDDIKANLYKNPDDYYYHQEVLPFYKETNSLTKSKVPFRLIFWVKKGKFKDLILKNFDMFLKCEKNYKMEFMEYFYDELPEEMKKEYQTIYQLYQTQPTTQIDEYITILMENNYEYLKEILKNKQISYVTSGSTTSVFKIDDSVLKLTEKKHEKNTFKDLFLIAKTDTKIIYGEYNNPLLIVETQKYLEKNHNNQEMTIEDINNFFNELDKQGFCITDPNCLEKNFNNFGFLEDYHDANLGNYSSYEELPDWFKERPIVLYDIDLVYRKDDTNKKEFVKLYI